MIYLFSLILCISLVWRYDFLNRTAYKKQCYYLLLVWFILVSGFQYMVGSDTELYVEKFRKFPLELSLNMIIERMEDRQQPGWVLISWLCRQFTDDFLIMKLIQAVVFNWAVFSFFNKESSNVFLCVFLYAVSIYLVTNFNVLRQSYAIAFGLYAVSYLKRDKYIKYVFFVLFAYMFHNSAVLLLILPIFKIIKYRKESLVLVLTGIILGLYLLLQLDYEELAFSFINSGIMSDNSTNIAYGYMGDVDLGINGGAHINYLVIIVAIVVIYYIVIERDFFWGGFGVCYLLFMIITNVFPILWRFRLYFDFGYYVLFAKVLIDAPKGRFWHIRHVLYIMAILLFSYYPYIDYMRQDPVSKFKYIYQYYPYHSIFDPIKEKRS